jgi:hypothetical protein
MKYFHFKRLKLISSVVALIFLQGSLLAQIPKGTFRLGPNLSHSSSTQKYDVLDLESKSSTTNLVISGGYFLINNLELSIDVQLINSKSENDGDELTSRGRAIGPSLTYMVFANKNLYLPLYIGMSYNTSTFEDEVDELTLKGWGYGAGLGLEFIVNNNLGARLGLQYTSGTLKEDEIDLETQLSGFQIGVGVNFYFTKK